MFQSIEKIIKAIQAIFNESQGQYSYTALEIDFYKGLRIDELFGRLDDDKQVPLFVSNISWIEFFSMYAELKGTRHKWDIEIMSNEIVQNLKHAWSFHKYFNAVKNEAMDIQIGNLINKIEAILSNLANHDLRSEIFYFHPKGHDYHLIALEFKEGVQVIELLWFID